MKRLMVAAAVAALAAGGAGLAVMPAQGASVAGGCLSTLGVETGTADVCATVNDDGTGSITADGAEANPDPADGFVSAANDGSQDEDGVCASAQGDPGEEYDENGNAIEDDEETPACDDALATAVAEYIVGGAPAPSL